MLKQMKPGRRYFIINIDEPYAEAIFAVLKCGEQMKRRSESEEARIREEFDVTFEEWIEETFGGENSDRDEGDG